MGLIRRVRGLFRRKELSADVDEELEFHLAMRAQLNAEEGMPRAEARANAVRRFGNVTRVRERMREIDVLTFPETVWQDTRFAARMLMKHPAFSAIAIVVLGLGIGVNTSMFSVLDAELLRPLPFALPEAPLPPPAATIGRSKHSPSGPRLAGKHDVSLLSLSMSVAEGFAAVGQAWNVVEDQAAKAGHAPPDRDSWRVLGIMHLHHPGPGVVGGGGDAFSWRPISS